MIYVFLAEGFEEMEALAPVDILRRAGLSVKTVGIGGKTIAGAHKIPVQADCTEDEMSLQDAEMVILPGGRPGMDHLDASKTVAEAVRFCAEHDRWIGAICAAPAVLGHLGVLRGKKATCFPGFESELAGAEKSSAFVVRDGRLITARGAGASVEFGLAIVAALKDEETAQQLRLSMQCPPLA